jgi:hypothetical protein
MMQHEKKPINKINMKKIKVLFSSIAIIAFVSCNNSAEHATTTEPAAESTAPAPAQTHTNETKGTKENPDHTDIGVDENGVSYSKKRGGNETDVKIKTDSNSIHIRNR